MGQNERVMVALFAVAFLAVATFAVWQIDDGDVQLAAVTAVATPFGAHVVELLKERRETARGERDRQATTRYAQLQQLDDLLSTMAMNAMIMPSNAEIGLADWAVEMTQLQSNVTAAVQLLRK